MSSRRGFVAGAGGLALATAFSGAGALAAGRPRRKPSLKGGRFDEGVISGDPTPDAITLWTRVSDVEGSGTVELEVARDRGFRRIVARDRKPVDTEFVGGSISSPGLGEGGGGILPGADPSNPNTPESIIDLLRSTNPWAADAEFDHHGYGLVEATRKGFSCTLRRVETVKRRSSKPLPDKRFSYRIGRGEPSLLG